MQNESVKKSFKAPNHRTNSRKSLSFSALSLQNMVRIVMHLRF